MTNQAYHEIELTITKAAIQANGDIRWQAVASDTGLDRVDERTSLPLFQDWIERIQGGVIAPFLPDPPRMPFLGLSHYPALDGFGEAGVTGKMYIDGDRFKADGNFYQDEAHPLGPALFGAIAGERSLLKKGETVTKPIRISAAWWDLQHAHGDFVFTRRSLADRCPMCDQGVGDKVYLKGQLDHFAATRVPMNPRTALDLEEKSMKKITRLEDAQSIIADPVLAEELERRAKLVGKASTETDEIESPEALVIRATSLGDYLRQKREEAEMSLEDAAADLDLEVDALTAIEAGQTVFPAKKVLNALAKLYDVSVDELLGMLPKPKKAEKAMMKTVEGEDYPAADFLVVEDAESPSTWHLQVRRHGKPDHGLMGGAWAALHGGYRGNKYEGPDKGKALQSLKKLYKAEEMMTPTVKMMNHEPEIEPEAMPLPPPLGGATTMDAAETFLDANEKIRKLYSNWDIFNQVRLNIMQDEEMPPEEKIEAMSVAVDDFGDRIAALKSSLADAFLLTTRDIEDEALPTFRAEQNVLQEKPIMIEEKIDGIIENKALSGEQKAAAIQEAFEGYAQTVRARLEDKPAGAPDSATLAATMKSAVAEALTPLAEQLGLLIAKLGQPLTGNPGLAWPQQKSLAPGYQPPPVLGSMPAMPVSPVIHKPSPLTSAIRRSVGIIE